MGEPRWLDEDEARAWRGYRRMCLLLNAQVNRDLARDSGLSEPDYDVLSNLGSSPDHRKRLSELAAHMLWSKSRLSHHLTRMELRGLVAREDCAADGRGSFVALTPAGLAALEAAAGDHVDSVRRHCVDLLSPEQLAMLASISETVLAPLTDRPSPPAQDDGA